jgi:hypothetical protein
MRGVRPRPPPFGWDSPEDAPRLGWRRSKEVLGGDYDPDAAVRVADAPALRFLRRAQWAPPVIGRNSTVSTDVQPAPKKRRGRPRKDAGEPIPARKTRQTPPARPSGAFHERPPDATAAARMRRYRERGRSGQIPVVVSVDEIAWQMALSEAGFLRDPDPDKKAIGEALSTMLDRLLHADLNTLLLRRNGP